MVQFIRTIPGDLDEAATIDGCGKFRLFSRIILPLILPALATSAIFSFYWRWEDLLGPVLYLNRPALYPVSMALKMFLDNETISQLGSDVRHVRRQFAAGAGRIFHFSKIYCGRDQHKRVERIIEAFLEEYEKFKGGREPMPPLVFDEHEIRQAIDRVVHRTFRMDFNWDWPGGVALLRRSRSL